jgi:hypothetical protein|tara:strand:- start:16 stop:567 length:552 start_codon:yes stop_codon:yes gene_type:complete
MGGDSSGSDGSAGGVRQSRPRGALTGVYEDNALDNKYDTRSGKSMATPNRSDLTGRTAADIAMNPFSKQATAGEKAAALAQGVIPGGFLLGGVRALGMMGRGSIKDNVGTDGGNQNVREAIKAQASQAKTSKTETVAKSKTEARRGYGAVAKATKTTRNKTMLSGSRGLLGDAPVQRKTLLGG